MNERIKKLWVDALRSGKYTQSQHALRTVSGYCCLGVLCDIATEETELGYWTVTHRGQVFMPKDWGYVPKSDTLPTPIVDWAELDKDNPETPAGSLAYLNDTGKSFLEIADIIEREL